MACEGEYLVFWFSPDVGTEHLGKLFGPRWLGFNRIIRHHTECRDDVFFEILVLVIAPDHDEIRRELVDLLPGLAKPGHQVLTMPFRRTSALILTPFPPHGLRPPLWAFVLL